MALAVVILLLLALAIWLIRRKRTSARSGPVVGGDRAVQPVHPPSQMSAPVATVPPLRRYPAPPAPIPSYAEWVPAGRDVRVAGLVIRGASCASDAAWSTHPDMVSSWR